MLLFQNLRKMSIRITFGVKLIVKQKLIVLLSIIMLLSVITSNCVQKSTTNNEHNHHYTHDSLFHIHEHTHSQSTHSHYHATNNISMLDYFCISEKNSSISDIEKLADVFKVSSFYSNDLIHEFFKPPRFS